MRSVKRSQFVWGKVAGGGDQIRRIPGEIVENEQFRRQPVNRNVILRLQRLEETNDLLAHEALILRSRIERIKQHNRHRPRGIFALQIEAIGERVRRQQASRLRGRFL